MIGFIVGLLRPLWSFAQPLLRRGAVYVADLVVAAVASALERVLLRLVADFLGEVEAL
jgi:hypothetical protein